MKKRIGILILSLFMALSLVGCGTYTPPANRPSTGGGSGWNSGEDDDPGGGGGGGTKPGGDGPSTPGGKEEDDTVFTVSLVLDGIPFTRTAGMQARWQNRYGIYSAEFVNGVASIKGLDGEYHVTLSALPNDGNDYTYDRNGIYASNKNRNVTVELLQVLKASVGSMGWYEITKLGTYRATVSAKPTTPGLGGELKNNAMFAAYYFQPVGPGWYTITSWVSTEENKVNPILYRYNGNPYSGFSTYDTLIDGGGTAGTYTKNFKLEYKIYDEQVGNAQLFAIGAQSATGYPVTVEFTVKYEGEYYNPYIGDPVYANGPFYTGAKPAGSWQYIYKDTGNVLLGSRVRLNPDDGFYHLYDENTYANGWGPLLFARLMKDNEVFWTYDFSVPPHQMDLGFYWNHFNDGNISCVINGDDYAYMITTNTDENGVRHQGYDSYCNSSDGAHPVTEEIKKFLQGYASREFFFNDGEGWAEIGGASGSVFLNSNEDDQWLFACGYYR